MEKSVLKTLCMEEPERRPSEDMPSLLAEESDVPVRGWEGIAEFWYGTSRPNYWLGFSTSRPQKRED